MYATYSPEDNKLRLYSSTRLDSDTYMRVKAAGFIWAPKQELFVAPMWTPERADLLTELCGEIGDEDTSLVDRAEQRAERFEDYSDKRAEDANAARNAVSAIADNIPLGQPILVGHHSERHARKDAERIENGMRRAVKMWETSEYWKYRAAGAIRAAKYKERPDVRHRRIKGLESDKRKQEKYRDEADMWLKLWIECGNELDAELQNTVALRIAGMCHLQLPRKEGDKPDFNLCPSAYDAITNAHPSLYAPRTLEEIVETAKRVYPRVIGHAERWINHLNNRIEYERAMLAEAGGTAADKFDIEVGGKVLIGGEWLLVKRVNKAAGRINSVTTNARYCHIRGIEEVKDYQAPEGDTAARIKAAQKLPPLCNYPGEGFKHITRAEWDRRWTDGKSTRVIAATETAGAHRVRHFWGGGMLGGGYGHTPLYITDEKRKDPPAPTKEPIAAPVLPGPERALPAPKFSQEVQFTRATNEDIAAALDPARAFDAMRETLKAGVQVVSAPQLFPTPPEIAARMVEAAEVEPGQCVLEPSAGTGNLVRAVLDRVDTEVLAYEINPGLCSQLSRTFPSYKLQVRCTDFLQVTDFQGCYERVLMNPPFERGSDIKHIRHALTFLKPGGRLVALCANGPRQQEELKPLAQTWEVLPAGSFREAGTGINVAMLTIVADA